MKKSTFHQVIGALVCSGRSDLAKITAQEVVTGAKLYKASGDELKAWVNTLSNLSKPAHGEPGISIEGGKKIVLYNKKGIDFTIVPISKNKFWVGIYYGNFVRQDLSMNEVKKLIASIDFKWIRKNSN